MKILRWLIILVVLAVAGIFAWQVFAPSEAAVRPSTAVVARGDIEQTVLATGMLEANSLTSVGAEVSGRIETLHVDLGDAVKQGDLIAEIDSMNQENDIRAAEAALANVNAQKRSKQASVTLAEEALTRSTRLLSQNLTSQADFQSATATVEMAKADIDALSAQAEQAQLSVEAAKLDLSRTKITSPVTGTVVAVMVSEGASVNAANTTPVIVKIADLDQMIIKAEISEADITKVKPGQRAYFSILGEPGVQVDATLLTTEPAPTSISSDTSASSDTAIYYNGVFRVQNPDHKLRISMTTQVTIILAEARDVLTIPSAALGNIDRDGRYTVHVYDPETTEITARSVTVGLNNNITAQITDGLQQGEQVLMAGSAGALIPQGGGRRGSGGVLGIGGGRGGRL